MDGNFADTQLYLVENGISLDSFGRETVSYFINPTNHPALNLIDIAILAVYSGSVVIEHALTVTEQDSYLLEAARTNVETSIGSYYADSSGLNGGKTWQLLSYEAEDTTTSTVAPTPTIPYFVQDSNPTPKPTFVDAEDTSQDLAEVNSEATSFGDLYLPLILVVVIATCTLLSVVLVIIRQFCHKARRRGSDKLRGYESGMFHGDGFWCFEVLMF